MPMEESMKRCTRSLWRSGALGLALLMIPLGLSFCSSEGEEGGLGLGEIPANGFPRAERIENLVQLRLTNYAFGFISENLDPLMTMLLGPEGLSFPLQAGVVDTVGIKIPRETTNITLELANVSIVPEQSMNAIGIHVELKSPNHSGLYIELPSSMLWGLEKCSFFATTDQPFPVEAYIRLTIEPDGAMSINFTEDDIQYDLDPLKLSGDGFTCTLTGGTANLAISLLQGAIEPLLTTQIYNAVNDALNGFLCYTCEDSPDECPVGSVCQDGMCMETGGRCHKKALGIEGSLDLGGLLGGFTGDATPRELYLAAMLGGYADVIGRPSPQYAGLELGMVGGTKAANPDASCAPVESYPRTPPARYQYSDVNPHNNNSIYHAVIGITENLLDQAGVPRAHMHLDPLVFPISTDPMHGKNFLETTRQAKQKFKGVRLSGGFSNVSFGMPQRKLLNMVFTYLAVEAGASSGIIDPVTMSPQDIAAMDESSEGFRMAKAFLTGEDMYGMEFIAAHREGRLG